MNSLKNKIVLIAPEIPGNTGSIGRTCLALGFELILIKPYGFDIDEKAVRRAGLDYWKHVILKEYDSWEIFLQQEKPASEHLFFFENDGKHSFFEAQYPKGCYLIFGGETKGIPQNLYEEYFERFYYLPMMSEHIRSLNLSNTATAVAYQAIRNQ